MLSKRLTSIISPPSPGINSKGAPTINVCGDEVPLEVYWIVLEMAETGRGKEDIAAQLNGRADAKFVGSSTRINKLIDNVLENQRLCKASGTILAVKHLHTSVPIGPAPRGRKSAMLQKARRVTTQISHTEPILRPPVSAEREEEKLVVEALRLAAERDALTKAMPDGNAKRRATATVDRQLKESLERHQLLDDDVASEDARTRIKLARQNLN